MQGKGANTERGQLHCVQKRDLDHPVRLCATARPVLITLYLNRQRKNIVSRQH